MGEYTAAILTYLNALKKRFAGHFERRKWAYIFGVFVWALVWYAVMDLLVYLQPEPRSLFPFDLMPLIAGGPIIVVGWRAVALGRQLSLAIEDFDDGAAFVFPANKPRAKRLFLDDLKNTISWYSKLVSIAIFSISLVGVLALTFPDGVNFAEVFLVLGVPLIAIPIGALLGQLVGYAQFARIMARNEIALASLSTPQAREALRSLESVHVFSVLALSILCFWFAGWWLVWGLGFSTEYKEMWQTQFLVLWVVSIALLVVAGIRPSMSFRSMLAEVAGGATGQRDREAQIKQAKSDLEQWESPLTAQSRQVRERIADVKRFIANLEAQRINSGLLDPRLLGSLMAMNLLFFVLPFLLPVAFAS